jgi:hypothetical protein
MVLNRIVPAVAVAALLAAHPAGQGPQFSDWSQPVNLGPVINSGFGDAGPALSKDSLSLYFHSNRPGGAVPPDTPGGGANDIYVSQRNHVGAPWSPPINLGPIVNSAFVEASPSLSRDGHWLFFQSNRPGGEGGLDIWASYRHHVHDDFAWQPPVNLGPGVNSPFLDTGASFFENDDSGVPQLFFGSNRPGGIGPFDIYVSELLPDGTWSPAQWIPELNSTAPDPGVSVRFDGLELFVFSSRPGGSGGQDLWTATRPTTLHPWSAPVNLGPLVNSASGDSQPHIAADRQTLFFASDRDGGFGQSDLYMTTRTRTR